MISALQPLNILGNIFMCFGRYTRASDVHPLKHQSAISSTEDGMLISFSAVHPLNELLLINFKPSGKTMLLSVSQPVKALLPMLTPVEGTTTVLSLAAVGGQYTISVTLAS
jgi:hypothetical protein